MVLMLLARGHCLALLAEILSSAPAFLRPIPQGKQEERHFYLAILPIKCCWKIALLLTIELLVRDLLEVVSARAMPI
jgi:hypothetical protein